MEKKSNTKKDKQDKRKKVAVVLTVLALLTILVGTFAWSSYTEWVKNHMQSQGFEPGKVTIIEEFNPEPIDVNPNIKKVINVANTSSADAFVRISFEEMLHKLADGADGKVFDSEVAAKFPLIFNASEFLKKTATPGDVEGNGGYVKTDFALSNGGSVGNVKLFVKGTGKDAEAVLVNIREMGIEDFPRDFDFEAHGTTFPIIDGVWETGKKAYVAQKMQGKPVKKTDGTYVVYTSTDIGGAPVELGLKADDAFGFHGYGVDITPNEVESDWVEDRVWVAAAAPVNTPANGTATGAYKKSSIAGSGILYDMANTESNPIKVGSALKDWEYYNGYFYYTKVLKAGATTETSVMQKVIFPDANADKTYKVASYNLWVGLEAIPAALSALEADSNGGKLDPANKVGEDKGKTVFGESNGAGWGFDSAATGSDKDLYEYFKSITTIVE